MEQLAKQLSEKQIIEGGEVTTIPASPLTAHEKLDGLLGQVREMVRGVIVKAIDEEFQQFLGGVESYERSERRTDQRNGTRRRELITELGTLSDVPIPRARKGNFLPSFLVRWNRVQKSVVSIVSEMFLRGVSTRKIGSLSKAIWGKKFSPQTVSTFNQTLKEDFLAWMNRPITSPIRYLYLDGIALKVRRKWISKEMLLCAIGITADGKKEFLGFCLGGVESSASWEFLLRQLKQRGLNERELALIITDGSPGLKHALATLLPDISVQRCIVHKLWNVTGHTPWSLRSVVPQEAKRIFYAPNEQDARALFAEFVQRWQKEAPKAVECVAKDIESLLVFYKFPFRHWTLIRSTNVIERAFKEFRRRVKIMETFPTEESCHRIMFALAKMLNENWVTKPLSNF